MTRKQDAEELTRELEAFTALFEEGIRETRDLLCEIRTALENATKPPEQRIDDARALLGEALKKLPKVQE